MCRLSAYIGLPIAAADLITRPNHSIIKQVSLATPCQPLKEPSIL
jgi:hypothetical protein